MTEEMNWFAFVVGLVGIIITIIVSVTIFQLDTNEKVLEMVKAGANPVSASCAINDHVQICMAAGMIENKK